MGYAKVTQDAFLGKHFGYVEPEEPTARQPGRGRNLRNERMLPSASATGRIVEPPGPSILTLVWIEPAREQNRLLANQEE